MDFITIHPGQDVTTESVKYLRKKIRELAILETQLLIEGKDDDASVIATRIDSLYHVIDILDRD